MIGLEVFITAWPRRSAPREPEGLYRTLLLEGRGAPGEATMVELAAVFGATVRVEDAPGGGMVTLWIEMPTAGPRVEK